MNTLTRRAKTTDLDRAAATLGDAFADYPWTRWTVDASEHQRRIVALQRIALEHFALPFGGASITTVAGEVQSVAAWSDSAALSATGIDHVVASQVAALEGSRHEASQAADREVDPLRPQHRHLYLGALGTARTLQGLGLATKTLAPLLRAGDQTGLDVWLETSSRSNVAYYQRLGFQVAFHVVIQGGGPEVWGMFRRPFATTNADAVDQKQRNGAT